MVRPTSDKVRAAVFSSLADAVEGAYFLDLFAGTGSVGIEAYSRGAAAVFFLDRDTSVLKKNLELLPKSAYKVITSDMFNFKTKEQFDIIYIDPPYGSYPAEKILQFVHNNGLLKYNGTIVYEESSRASADWSAQVFKMFKQRKYGDTLITYLEYKEG